MFYIEKFDMYTCFGIEKCYRTLNFVHKKFTYMFFKKTFSYDMICTHRFIYAAGHL